MSLPLAIDAMGGDNGPGVVVEGVLEAIKAHGGEFLIVGDSGLIQKHLDRFKARNHPSIKVIHADEVISMIDSPVDAVREKTRSSLVLAAREVKEGRAAGLVSPGNTGAVLAAGTLLLGRIRGVERPGIATILPTAGGHSVLIDVGANVDSRPKHLLQFGIMGAIYATAILGIREPRVGLLSIGEEKSKGNELTREAFPLLERLPNFLGNVEGRDIINGNADVVVCDGFVGNVVLKFGEGLAFTIIDLMKERLLATPLRKLAAGFLKSAFSEFKKKIDYSEYGGAPLLGVRYPCIICHGSSKSKAIKNAIRVTREAIDAGVCAKIEEMIKKVA